MKISPGSSLFFCTKSKIYLISSTLTSHAATEVGPYPTRRRVILVTPDPYKNLISTGHAAIVWNEKQVIESLSDGVGIHDNNWKKERKKYIE